MTRLKSFRVSIAASASFKRRFASASWHARIAVNTKQNGKGWAELMSATTTTTTSSSSLLSWRFQATIEWIPISLFRLYSVVSHCITMLFHKGVLLDAPWMIHGPMGPCTAPWVIRRPRPRSAARRGSVGRAPAPSPPSPPSLQGPQSAQALQALQRGEAALLRPDPKQFMTSLKVKHGQTTTNITKLPRLLMIIHWFTLNQDNEDELRNQMRSSTLPQINSLHFTIAPRCWDPSAAGHRQLLDAAPTPTRLWRAWTPTPYRSYRYTLGTLSKWEKAEQKWHMKPLHVISTCSTRFMFFSTT